MPSEDALRELETDSDLEAVIVDVNGGQVPLELYRVSLILLYCTLSLF